MAAINKRGEMHGGNRENNMLITWRHFEYTDWQNICFATCKAFILKDFRSQDLNRVWYSEPENYYLPNNYHLVITTK